MNFLELPIPSPPERTILTNWILQVVRIIINVIQRPKIPLSYEAPAHPVDGELYFPDGVMWDPGSGRGIYVADAAAPGGYRFLG